jgi:bacterioferritin-associated ferredoxin
MIVCSCNVLSDRETRNVATAARVQPLSAHQVYGCLGCNMRCGRCARTVKQILSEALIVRVHVHTDLPPRRGPSCDAGQPLDLPRGRPAAGKGQQRTDIAETWRLAANATEHGFMAEAGKEWRQ